MERAQYHISQLNNALTHGSIVLSSASRLEDGLIHVNRDHLIECSGNVELSMSIRKRFASRRFRSVRFLADTLVYTCLSSSGYSINHNVLRSIAPDLLLYVWEFIQTVSVSSGPSLREMITRLSRGRTKEGYEAIHPSLDHSRQYQNKAEWGGFEEVHTVTWIELDSPSHSTCSTFFEAGLVDRIVSKCAATPRTSTHLRSLCLEALQTSQE